MKKQVANPGRRSAHHVRQSPFKGSNRQIRGMILKTLIRGKMTGRKLKESLDFGDARIEEVLQGLVKDGLIEKRGRSYTLVS